MCCKRQFPLQLQIDFITMRFNINLYCITLLGSLNSCFKNQAHTTYHIVYQNISQHITSCCLISWIFKGFINRYKIQCKLFLNIKKLYYRVNIIIRDSVSTHTLVYYHSYSETSNSVKHISKKLKIRRWTRMKKKLILVRFFPLLHYPTKSNQSKRRFRIREHLCFPCLPNENTYWINVTLALVRFVLSKDYTKWIIT